jgi:hypothetical protein
VGKDSPEEERALNCMHGLSWIITHKQSHRPLGDAHKQCKFAYLVTGFHARAKRRASRGATRICRVCCCRWSQATQCFVPAPTHAVRCQSPWAGSQKYLQILKCPDPRGEMPHLPGPAAIKMIKC